MKYIDSQIFQFVGNNKPLSIDLDADPEIITGKLMARDKFHSSAESIDIDDISFDCDPTRNHLYYYIRIYPG